MAVRGASRSWRNGVRGHDGGGFGACVDPDPFGPVGGDGQGVSVVSILHGSSLLAILTLSTVTRALAQEAQLIAAAQRVSAASLESTQPDVPFERWLAELGRVPRSAIRWEVNDCGEGGDGREAPTCVEAILKLAADTTAHASLVVAGSGRRGPQAPMWALRCGAGAAATRVPEPQPRRGYACRE